MLDRTLCQPCQNIFRNHVMDWQKLYLYSVKSPDTTRIHKYNNNSRYLLKKGNFKRTQEREEVFSRALYTHTVLDYVHTWVLL